ncbi:hypothetical protein QBC34DRAFT_443239 [Podospora aff. communis PSN243]|uniref:Uncharacterized protein n=1 Tax=Podospora aff. communis PSN243 TaxID=3040156 RepID=A0AAV9G918_9PEZI|nr:hypothetical protein QBC34DRAFT_443239 [Podospora aff. communis PSN243]
METSNSTPPTNSESRALQEAGPSQNSPRPVSPKHQNINTSGAEGEERPSDGDPASATVSPSSSIATHELDNATGPSLVIEATVLANNNEQTPGYAAGQPVQPQAPNYHPRGPPLAPSPTTHQQTQGAHTATSLGPPPITEVKPFGSWRPGYLRKRSLFAFFCSFLALAAAVEAVYLISESRNGLEEANEALSWLWTFSPTIAMTLLASLWTRVGYQAKRYIPWIRLARWRADSNTAADKLRRKASRTILIDYPNLSPLKAIRKAVAFGDHLVTAAIVVSFVIYVQITISTGLINSEPRQFNEAISILVEDRFTAAGRDDGRASLPMVAINGMATLNMTIPNGHTPRHVFQWFSSHPDSPSASLSGIQASVDIASLDVKCEVPTLADPVNEFAPDTLFLQFTSSFCTSRRLIVEIQAQNSIPIPEGRSYFWVYDDRAACVDNRKGIVLAAVVAADRKGENLTYVSSSQVMCSVGLAFGNATVNIANGHAEVSAVVLGETDAEVDILSELQNHRLDNVREGSDLQANTGADYTTELQLSPFRVGASLIPGGPPEVQSLLEHQKLEEVITTWIQHFGAILLHYNHRTPDQRVAAGQGWVIRDRLMVNKNVAHGMAGGFVLMAIMAAWMIFCAPPAGGFVPRDPDTISGCAVLLSKSTDLLTTLRGTGNRTLEEITDQLPGSYRTVIQSSPDNALSPSFFLRKDGLVSAQVIPGPRQTNGAGRGEFRWSPFGLRLPVRCIGVVAMLGIGATAGGLLVRSNRDNGFFNTGDNPNTQYLWTILPTLVMELLTIYVKGCDFSIRALAPFTALQSRSDTFERALSTSYTNELGPVTIVRAWRRGNVHVVISKVMTILCRLLPIITNALFSMENLEVKQAVQLQQQTWFGSGDYATYSWQAPAYVADMLLRNDASSTFPPWSYEDWAFHVQTPIGDAVARADPTNLSVKARLAAVSVDLACSLDVTPGPISAENGIPMEVGGRNVTCFGGFSCRKHRYFAGSAGGHYLSPVCSTDLPPTTYIWGRCTGNTIDFIAQAVCNEIAVEQDFDATLSGPNMSLDTSINPPTPLPDTLRPHPFHGNITDIYTGLFPGDDNLLASPPGAYLDRFFRSLVTRKLAMPLSHLDSPTTVALVTAAIKKQHALIRAQTLNFDGHSKMAVTPAIRLPFSSNGTKPQYPPFTTPQPSPQPATLHHAPNRLVQSPTATYITLVVLAAVLLLNIISIVLTKEIQMPKSPGGIAAVASLLADSTIFKHLPSEGVEWMGDAELAEYFRGRGVMFKMDWFREGYTIGVVEGQQVQLGEVVVGGEGDEEGLVGGAAGIGNGG